MRIFLLLALVVSLSVGKTQTIDTLLTDYANFLANKPCLSNAYKELQSRPFYQDHQKTTEKIWGHINDTTIAKILQFNEGKNIIESDTNTCFYPFGGPDFLYANVFYPQAKNYVLMGLERCGTITDISKKNQADIDLMLEHLNQSMLYLNKSGYFVTSHMSKDFSKSLLNGTIQPILYFAARRNYQVVSLKYGYINQKGEFTHYKTKNESQYFTGYNLTLVDSTGKQRNVYYFSADIADYKIKTKAWFVPFVKAFGKNVTYLKSASYIPAHKNFSVVRNLILENSVKIIQDDTGIPYKILNDKTKWDLSFWGTYTMTIKDLSWGFQEDLKQAVKNHPNGKKLPFKISYNGNYGEGIILVARKKN